MGVSHHTREYEDMKHEFRKEISDWLGAEDEVVEDLVRKLFSIMNDYNAVDWT